jgi:formylmethanofuran dehydrogenase subunit E
LIRFDNRPIKEIKMEKTIEFDSQTLKLFKGWSIEKFENEKEVVYLFKKAKPKKEEILEEIVSSHICDGCGKEFDENDLEIINSCWFCKKCEDEIQQEAERQEEFCN